MKAWVVPSLASSQIFHLKSHMSQLGLIFQAVLRHSLGLAQSIIRRAAWPRGPLGRTRGLLPHRNLLGLKWELTSFSWQRALVEQEGALGLGARRGGFSMWALPLTVWPWAASHAPLWVQISSVAEPWVVMSTPCCRRACVGKTGLTGLLCKREETAT